MSENKDDEFDAAMNAWEESLSVDKEDFDKGLVNSLSGKAEIRELTEEQEARLKYIIENPEPLSEEAKNNLKRFFSKASDIKIMKVCPIDDSSKPD